MQIKEKANTDKIVQIRDEMNSNILALNNQISRLNSELKSINDSNVVLKQKSIIDGNHIKALNEVNNMQNEDFILILDSKIEYYLGKVNELSNENRDLINENVKIMIQKKQDNCTLNNFIQLEKKMEMMNYSLEEFRNKYEILEIENENKNRMISNYERQNEFNRNEIQKLKHNLNQSYLENNKFKNIISEYESKLKSKDEVNQKAKEYDMISSNFYTSRVNKNSEVLLGIESPEISFQNKIINKNYSKTKIMRRPIVNQEKVYNNNFSKEFHLLKQDSEFYDKEKGF